MNDNVTRRDVLRRGIAATGVATVGAAGLSGTAAATSDCTKTVGYWKNHPEDWPRDRIRIERGETPNTYSKETMLNVLNEPPRGDKALIMAKQVIAAQLSIAGLGGPDAGVCDIESVKETMEEGITWLDCADGTCADGWDYLADPDNYEATRSWVDGRGVDGEPIKDRLDAFNNGEFCENCGGDGDGRDDESRGNGNEGADGGNDEENGNGPPDHAGGSNVRGNRGRGR